MCFAVSISTKSCPEIGDANLSIWNDKKFKLANMAFLKMSKNDISKP